MKIDVDFCVRFDLADDERFHRGNIAYTDPDVLVERVTVRWDPTDPEGWYAVSAVGVLLTKKGEPSKSSAHGHHGKLSLAEEEEWLERAKAASTRVTIELSTTT